MTTESQDLFVIGQRIDRYEIREHVGQGGMGAVYRAIDSKLGRTVALKTVVAHRRGDRLTEEIRERFMREALAASRVDHRNVVQVLDFGFADDGTPYMVMEYLRGKSLSAILKSAGEPLALDYVADVMLSVCAALRACHHVGIIHRDLKPANIFLCDTDTGWEVKVLDFGISKAPAADELTQDGQIIGTPQYLSPEQIEGTVGPESDQYALGVLMYVCLTQRLPYASYQSMRLLRAISEGKFDPPRKLRADLPEGLEAIVLRAMHVSPKERFESIHALGQRLWEFASARGQAQWKTFYFHTPAVAQPPRALVHKPAPLNQSAKDDVPRKPDAGSTASLEPASALAKTEPAQPSTVGPSGFVVTKTVAASGLGEATNVSHSDIAGESALSDARDAAGHSGARRVRLARVAAVLVGVAAIGLVIQRASRNTAPATMPGSAAVRPTNIVAPTFVPVAQPAPRPLAAPPPMAAPVREPPTAQMPEEAAAKKEPPPDPPRKKQATRRHRPPKIDQHGIGIPSE
jgi:eukaryotic-like serine/threonine-protein kinase